MKQMIASWSMVMVHGLMVAGLTLVLKLRKSWARELALPGGAFGTVNQMCDRSGGSDVQSNN